MSLKPVKNPFLILEDVFSLDRNYLTFCYQLILYIYSFFCSDMFIDEAKSSTFLYSWIGQPVEFVCQIILKPRADSPSFKWKNVDKNITITENITVSRERSVLVIAPKDESDFGSYKCYVDTYRTNIKRNMTLVKVGKLVS